MSDIKIQETHLRRSAYVYIRQSSASQVLINRESTDVYLESDKIATPKKVEANVSLLHNLFDDQINIVHIIVGGVRKSEKLDYPDKKVEQTFN